MRNPIKYFPQFLRIEMDDLQDDLEYLIKTAKSDYEAGKITERVFLENQTLFKNELMGVMDFNNFLVTHTSRPIIAELDSQMVFFLKRLCLL